MTMRWRSVLAIGLVGIAATSCLSSDQHATVNGWLNCIDFCQDRRDSVDRLASGLKHWATVYRLGGALAGPRPELVENMRQQFRDDYALTGGSTTEPHYVAVHVDNYVATYQRRAALSLGDIGSNFAKRELREALEQADARRYRADVIAVIEGALYDPLTGSLSDSTGAILDTIVLRGPGSGWLGSAAVALSGAPFPDDLVVTRWGSDSLAFVLAAYPGLHTLTARDPTGGDRVEQTAVRIGALPTVACNRSDRPCIVATAPEVTATLPTTVLSFVSTRLPADSAYHSAFVRLEPAASVAADYVATVAWPSSVVLAVAWHDCATFVAAVGPTEIAGAVYDFDGTPLEAAQVSIVGTVLDAVTNVDGEFTFPVAPPGVVELRISRLGFAAHIVRPVTRGSHRLAITLTTGVPRTPGPGMVTSTRNLSAGDCRLLEVTIPRDSTMQIARIRVTSP